MIITKELVTAKYELPYKNGIYRVIAEYGDNKRVFYSETGFDLVEGWQILNEVLYWERTPIDWE